MTQWWLRTSWMMAAPYAWPLPLTGVGYRILFVGVVVWGGWWRVCARGGGGEKAHGGGGVGGCTYGDPMSTRYMQGGKGSLTPALHRLLRAAAMHAHCCLLLPPL